VRSRATMNRPFTRVREMQVAAEDRYRSKIKDLEKSLQDAQTRLNELQQAKPGGGQQKFILSAEQQAELERFKQKQAEVNKELKEVRKDLRREIDSLENRLKWLNIAGMPLLVTVAGISLAFVKRKRTAAR
jgi:chromosome segregation ATPase